MTTILLVSESELVKTLVSFDERYGMWGCGVGEESDLTTLPKAESDALICLASSSLTPVETASKICQNKSTLYYSRPAFYSQVLFDVHM